MTVQALAGHLLVVGGRAVRMPPPGALAETAPKHAPRARADDTFFTLIAPAEQTRAPAAFYEELAQLGADSYFGSGGGITGGLREAMAAIHQRVLAEEAASGKRLRVSAVAAVLRGDEVYTVRAGPMFGVIRQGDDLASFPADRQDALAMNLLPLGSGPEPDIQLSHYAVAPGQMMLIADGSLSAANDDTLRAALSADGARAALDAIKPLAGSDAFASVIQFVAPGTPDPDGLAPQPDPRSPRAAPIRAPKPPAPAESPSPVMDRELDQAEPVPPAEPRASAPLEEAAQAGAGEPAPVRKWMQPRIPEFAGAMGKLKRPSFRAGDAIVADDTAAPLESDVTQEIAPPRREPSAPQRAIWRVKETARDALRATLAGTLATVDFLSRLLDQILPPPGEQGRQGIPTNVAVGLVVLIPVVIVIVVVGLALSEQGKTEFEVYLERAQTAHDEALRLSGSTCPDNQALRPLWVEVLKLSDQAIEFRPGDLEALNIRADAQNYLDCLDGVDRRDLTLLREFPPDAELVGPIMGGGFDLFTLDRQNDAIYHDTLNANGDGLTASGNTPILRRGQMVPIATGNFIVGDLLDIEWLQAGGAANDNVLVALERSGILWAYSPTFFTTAQQLITEDRWQNPIAIAVFRANLYVLDTGANQIWRYVAPAGERAYSAAPEEYFNGEELPDLSQAVDFGISNEGAVYVLLGDGTVKKYRRNVQSIVEEQPFNYLERPPGAIMSGATLFVDNDPASASLYIVDRVSAAIYRTSWSGRYNRGYRPGNAPGAFDDLTGFYADQVVRNNMYVLSGNKLFFFRRN